MDTMQTRAYINAFRLAVIIVIVSVFFAPAARAADTTLVPTGATWTTDLIKALPGAPRHSMIQHGAQVLRSWVMAMVTKLRHSALDPTPTTSSSPATFAAPFQSLMPPSSTP